MILLASSLLLGILFGYIRHQSMGPYRNYNINLVKPLPNAWGAVGGLEVGVAKRDVTPDLNLYDAWIDEDYNSKFSRGVDTYHDRNSNGTFDLPWMGGFHIARPAQGVNDPLWARAIAFRNNGVTIVLVSIDSIGITLDRYIAIRKMISNSNPSIDHVVFSATHSHQAPDTMGLWSYFYLWWSRFNDSYIRHLQRETHDAVLEAVANLRPAEAVLATAFVPQNNFTRDSRDPQIVDNQLPLAWFKDKVNGKTIGILASWGMHPEAMGRYNTMISSDFIHYFRKAMEEGLSDGKGSFLGFGGTCLYFSGPLGGQMNQLDFRIVDRFGVAHSSDGIKKAQAQGENLAILGAQALRSPAAQKMIDQRVAFSAKTHFAVVGWPIKLALYLGVVHPGLYHGKAKTEVNALNIGEIGILTTPGEIFPEIFYGGIESPKGADFGVAPQEVPPLIDVMRGTIKMNFNLANDEVGYIVPKSQWDQAAPYTYNNKSSPYGEIYTGNPDLAAGIHAASIAEIKRLKHTLKTQLTR